LSNNTNISSSFAVKVENRRKINVDVYKNHETTPTMNLSPGDQATFSSSTIASTRDSKIIPTPQLDSIQVESCGSVFNPRCDIRYLKISSSKDLPAQPLRSETRGDQLLKKEGDGEEKPIVSVTLGQDEPPAPIASCQGVSCTLFGAGAGIALGHLFYNVSPFLWGGALAASVIGGIVALLITRAKKNDSNN
jgi:hypothetical protein